MTIYVSRRGDDGYHQGIIGIRFFRGAFLGNECHAGEMGNGVKQISQDSPGKSGNISRCVFEI
jgi:hypothetical protein